MKIFLSYRRQDSEWVTLTLYNELRQQLKDASIFKDFNTIKPSEDFTKAIDDNLKSCDLLIVVIGKQWLTCEDSEGNQRIFKDDDFVRMEIANALKNNKKVIPVLVDGAIMPSNDQLPNDLKELHKKQSVTLSNTNFEMDVFTLANAIKEISGTKNEYSTFVNEIVKGNVSEREVIKPDGNKAYAYVCIGIGLLILLLNYDDAATSFICLLIIGAGIFAYTKSSKVKGLWLEKKFEEARAKSRGAKLISIIAPISGMILIFIVIILNGLKYLANGGMDDVNKVMQALQKDSMNNSISTPITTYHTVYITSLYESPNEDTKTINFLFEFTDVIVLQKQYGFAEVQWNNPDGTPQTGWVKMSELEKND